MAEFPALPLWTDAYLADTTDLSAEEHGVYLLLLMAAWRSPTCSLPDDDQRLARMARIGTKKWRKMRPTMARFFSVEDGQWTQKRLLRERDRVETSRSQKRQAAHAKHAKNKDNGSAAAGAETVRKPCNPYPYPESPVADADARASGEADLNKQASQLAAECRPLVGVDEAWSGFMDAGEVRRWLRAGCDPDRDIKPTIKRLMAKRTHPPNGWRYFTQAIADAKATNETPMPEGKPDDQHQPRANGQQQPAKRPANPARAVAERRQQRAEAASGDR